MPEPIKAYKPICCSKAYINKSSAVRHEKKCPYNKNNRACQTCKHRQEGTETFYNPNHNGNPGSTDFDVKYWWCEHHEKYISIEIHNGNTIYPQTNCEHWEEV